MGYKFSKRSLRRMEGIHCDLRKVMDRAIQITPVDFTVLEGLRDIETQRRYVRTGKSQTMNSRHLTGHAIDIAPLDENGDITWEWPLYYKLADYVKQAAKDVGVKIEWGGDWRSFKDGPHWQLPWREYPK